MVELYFEIGSTINELIENYNLETSQNEILKLFSEKLTREFGQGFSVSSLKKMKKFYLTYKGGSTLWNQLSWSHNRLIMNIDNEAKRNFYLEETIKSNWSVRQLERQINSFYYERLLSTSEEHKEEVKNEINILEKKEKVQNFIKDPYVLEFLLELGRGFSFVARQKRIDVDGDNFYIDLVFYNYVLKCFVLIDLKLDKLMHQDIGQMDFYVRYYDNEIKAEDDNPTIGIILCSDKKDTIVKYSVLNDNKNLFASKYQLYLPTEEELVREIEKQKEEFEDKKYCGFTVWNQNIQKIVYAVSEQSGNLLSFVYLMKLNINSKKTSTKNVLVLKMPMFSFSFK